MALVIEKFKKGRSIQTEKETSNNEGSKKTNEETKEDVIETPLIEQVPLTQVADDYTIHYNDKEYDPVWVRDYIEKNVNTFINNENMTLGQAEKFRETIKDIILPSIDAKVLDFSDPYTLNVPTSNSSDGYYNKAGSGIFNYDITDDNKAGMIAATRYLRSLLSSPDAVSKKPKETYNGDKVLIKALAEKLGNGSAAAFKSVWEAYTPKERKQALQEVLGSLDYNNIFKLYNFDETNTRDVAALLAAVANLQNALKNDKAKDDKLDSSTFTAAGKVGISLLNSLLYGEEKQLAPATPVDATGADAGVGVDANAGDGANSGISSSNGLLISLKDVQAVDNVNSIFNEMIGGLSNLVINIEPDNKYVLNPEIPNSGVQLQKDIDALNANPISVRGKKYKWKDAIEYTNNNIFKNLVNGNLRTENSSEWKILDRTAIKLYYYTLLLQAKALNPNATKAFAYYDPESKKVVVADFLLNKFVVGNITINEIYASDEGRAAIDKILSDNNLNFEKYNQIMSSVSSNKKGGTLKRKYLEGGKAAQYTLQIKDNIKANNDNLKPEGMDQKVWDAQTTLMSDGENINLTPSDYTRMAALALDIIALGASFGVGYGSLAAGVLGVTSSLTDFAADAMDEGTSTGRMWGNLAANLGLAAVGLIPGGKVGSIGAKLAKWGSKLVKYAAIVGGTQCGLEVYRIWDKGNKIGFNNLSKDDWTGLIRALLGVAGLGTSLNVTHYKAKALDVRNPATAKPTSVTIKGNFKKPAGAETGGVFKSDKELKFDLSNPEHARHWEALKGKSTNTERVAYLKEKGLIANEPGQKIQRARAYSLQNPENGRFKRNYNLLVGDKTAMARTEEGRLFTWDEYKDANTEWAQGITGREDRALLRGYLDALSRENPAEYLNAIREINTTLRPNRRSFFKWLDELPAKLVQRWNPALYGHPSTASNPALPTTPTGSPIVSIASPYNPLLSRLYRLTVLYEKRGGILSSNVQFAKQVLSYKKGGKSSKTAVIDYSIILNSPEYKKAWEKVLDELDANPNSNILELINDLLNSWLTNSNNLFGSEGYTGTIKKGNGAVTSRRQIFNNTELGKAINTIISANDGLDDYFGPLENTRHFGRKEHLSLVSKIIEDLISEGQKNNKYKNLKSLKVVDNNGILGFQLSTSGEGANGNNSTGTDANGAGGTSVDVGTPLSTKSDRKININLPLLYADTRYNNTLNSQKRINDLYHTYQIGFDDPTRQSFIYNDNYSPIKNMELQAASNLNLIQGAASSSDPSVNNAALLEGIRTNNKALADARVQADANIRETNKLNQAVADANAKEAVETANRNRAELDQFNNKMVDIDVSNALALHNSKDRYLAEQQQIATQKLMLANAMDYSKYTEALNAQVFHEQSELAKLARQQLADLAEKLKGQGKSQEEIYNDPEFIALSNSFLKQMHEIVSRHRMNSADYLGSLISFNPYTWVRPDNMTFDVSYTPSFKSSAPTNTRVTVGKRGLKLRKGGEAKYSYDKAKEAYLKFLRDDYKLVSKRNAKVLHGQYK